MSYDPENQLKAFSQAGTTVVEYGYADDGARLWKRVNQDPAQVQLWIGKIYEEKNDTAATPVKHTLFHVLAGDQLVCTFEAGSALAVAGGSSSLIGYYYHEDNLNSSSVLSSSSGTLQEVNVYYPFGRTQTASPQAGFQVSRRFTGQILDAETGLYYYNFRYYDPELGRFIQPDDRIPDLSNPQSYNRYTYCLNNPLRYTDPDGHWAQEVSDWWASTVSAGAGHISAGPSHWFYNGLVGTANSLVGGVAAPLTLGSAAGHVYGNPNATGKQVLIASVTEAANLAAIIPAAAGAGKAVSTLVRAGEKEAVGEVAEAALGGCFVAGTFVVTENGLAEIQNVKVGDLVWSHSMPTGEWQLRPVEAAPVRDYIGDVITVGVGGAVIEATGNHPIWVVAGEGLSSRQLAQDLPEDERIANASGRWVEARSLQVGDELLLLNNESAKITSLSERQDHLLVYNLHVTGNHTYAVSQAGVLVHNKAMQVKPVSEDGPHFSGTEKPRTEGATPNSTYTHIDPKTGKAVQNAIYDSEGNVVGHVDFKNHGPGAPSGHGHTFPEPGNPASGHGPGKPHIPNDQLPSGWDKLPPGVEPKTPKGS